MGGERQETFENGSKISSMRLRGRTAGIVARFQDLSFHMFQNMSFVPD